MWLIWESLPCDVLELQDFKSKLQLDIYWNQYTIARINTYEIN